MTTHQLTYLSLLESWHPMPWFMDQHNDSGVCVKDCKGEIVFYEDFGSIPDEMPAAGRERIIASAGSLAMFLVAFSEAPHG